MRSPSLELKVTGEQYSLTPLPYQVGSPCTYGHDCPNRASHRLLRPHERESVLLLCDSHTLEWAQTNGLRITTARLGNTAA
jgi:hypothetical protein